MLNVRVLGNPSGRTVLALHGLNGNGGRMAGLAERLGYRLVCPDLRGHGLSPGDPPWHLDQVVSDVVAMGLHGPLDAIGYSFGGLVAAALAARRPDVVHRLVLLEPAIGLAPEFVGPMAARALEVEAYDSPAEAVEHLATVVFPQAGRAGMQAEVDEFLVRSADGRYRWRTRPEAVVTALSEMCRMLPPPVQPTLLVRAAGNPHGAEAFAAACAGAKHVRIETLDCGHRLLVEKPAETAELIRSFLDPPPRA
jgi:lipase